MKNKKPFIMVLESKERFKRLLGNSRIRRGLAAGFVSLKKGDSVGEHNTLNKEEILVILTGKGFGKIGKKQFLLRKGMVLFIPPNTLHDIKNISSGILSYVYVTGVA